VSLISFSLPPFAFTVVAGGSVGKVAISSLFHHFCLAHGRRTQKINIAIGYTRPQQVCMWLGSKRRGWCESKWDWQAMECKDQLVHEDGCCMDVHATECEKYQTRPKREGRKKNTMYLITIKKNYNCC
jgi:hypothetical protein